MYIDFLINDVCISDSEARDLVKQATDTGHISSITVPYYLIKSVKQALSTTSEKIDISGIIDYPLGLSDLKTRQFATQQVCKTGVDSIDVIIPQNLAANRKYDKIREDVKSTIEIAKELNIKVKYILEYRVFDHHCLKKICEIFDDFEIKYVYPSTGYFVDNLADNILASIFLYKNSKDLNIICSGNLWTDKHFSTIQKSGLFGFRTSSLDSLKNFVVFNSSHR
jgi:deoxyribose-phosphate aldolase